MGTRAKQRAENERIRLDFTYGVIDKCILKALLGEDSLIMTTESMVNRVYQRVDAYVPGKRNLYSGNSSMRNQP